jgi:hypothetical protein
MKILLPTGILDTKTTTILVKANYKTNEITNLQNGERPYCALNAMRLTLPKINHFSV